MRISIAALLLVGVMMTGCASKENFQQPEQTSNLITLTISVNMDDEDAATRALAPDGTATFAVGEQLAVIYTNTSGNPVKAVSEPLAAGDLYAEGHGATFTVTVDSPDISRTVTYIYPAAMANDDGSANYAALDMQDGTLATLANKLEYCTATSSWTYDGKLPTLILAKQLSILAITLKNSTGIDDITNTITGLTLSDGVYTYKVKRDAAAGPIYLAIRPTSEADLEVTANSSSKYYSKSLTGKTYWDGYGYSVTWRMSENPIIDLSNISSNYTAKHGDVLTGTLGANVRISIEDGATVTLDGVSINADGTWKTGNYAGINCEGDATIILKEGTTNTVKGFNENYPGIHVPSGKTLTIQGSGSLNASSNGYGAGIGGGYGGGSDPIIDCGNINILGGRITATGGPSSAGIGSGRMGHCGDITISRGTIIATGGSEAAGIGGGNYAHCGNVTINSGAIVMVTKGNEAPNSIGAGYSGTCGTVTIDGVEGAIATSPYKYPALAVDLADITENTTFIDGTFITGTLGAKVKLSIPEGATVTLQNVTINGANDGNCRWGGINVEGNATIILKGTNEVKGFFQYYPGIFVYQGKTLTIRGDGSLNASSNGYGCGIGGGYNRSGNVVDCGDINIEGGTITATGGQGAAGIGGGMGSHCGNIYISGGTITATGGLKAAGIGGGHFDLWHVNDAYCGNITITSGVNRVTATKGFNTEDSVSIGYGSGCHVGTVTIGGTVYYENNEFKNGGETYLHTSPLIYQPVN